MTGVAVVAEEEDLSHRLQDMQFIEQLIHRASGGREVFENHEARITSLEEGQLHLQLGIERNTRKLENIGHTITDLKTGQEAATEVLRDIRDASRLWGLKDFAQALGKFTGWLLKTNTGRGFLVIGILVYVGITHDIDGVKTLLGKIKQ